MKDDENIIAFTIHVIILFSRFSYLASLNIPQIHLAHAMSIVPVASITIVPRVKTTLMCSEIK